MRGEKSKEMQVWTLATIAKRAENISGSKGNQDAEGGEKKQSWASEITFHDFRSGARLDVLGALSINM